MIADFDECDWSERHCDVCIIGAGAAGITIARELSNLAYSVIVLEGGGRSVEAASQEPYQSHIVGLPHQGVHSGRTRAFGGTTHLWAGQALPLFAIDFEPRNWVPHSGWPIRREELTPYYRRAEAVMQMSHVTYDEKTWPRKSLPISLDQSRVRWCYSQFAQVPNFAEKYRRDLAALSNITVLTHANAVALEANAVASGVDSALIRSFKGKAAKISATFFVICCGGIDSARLLLASNSVEHDGIGNRFDVVGRYFQDHPTIKVAFKPRDAASFDQAFGAVREKSLHLLKCFPTDEFQREKCILNVGAEVVHDDIDGDPVAAAFRIARSLRTGQLGKTFRQDVTDAVKHPLKVGTAVARKAAGKRGRSSAQVKHALLVSSEQEPDCQSRVTLSDAVDSVGMRRAQIHWRLTDSVSRSIRIFLEQLSREWKLQSIADLNVNDLQLEKAQTGTGCPYSDINHHIGATRMGVDPRTSVVNASCQVRGYENLYIASSSVFPTGGFSNPTLTVLALSCRIADELREKLRNTFRNAISTQSSA